jgi:glycosyltransferase involved in cell wall biosynthesis
MTARIVDQMEAGPDVAALAPRVQPRRVVFAIGHMGPGGAQRVVANAANSLVERGLEMHIVTLSQTPPDAYRLHPAIVRHRLGGATRSGKAGPAAMEADEKHRGPIKRALRPAVLLAFAALLRIKRTARALLKRSGISTESVRGLRKTLAVVQPDCVFSFLTRTNVIALMAARGMDLRIVISERNDPRLQRHPKAVETARRILYPRATVVTANTRGALEALEAYVPKEKLAFLPNPLTVPAERNVARFDAPTFLTVARLVEQKGIDTLVRAAALALPELPGWRLAIVGDGPLRAPLEELARDLGVADRIDWIGHVDDPFPYLRAARFFVLPSRFEGSPNALLEAMSCGLASIVTDASPGPLELIGEESAGLVVPVDDWQAMSRSIVALAGDDRLRDRLSAGALERSEPHLPEVALRTWLEVIA